MIPCVAHSGMHLRPLSFVLSCSFTNSILVIITMVYGVLTNYLLLKGTRFMAHDYQSSRVNPSALGSLWTCAGTGSCLGWAVLVFDKRTRLRECTIIRYDGRLSTLCWAGRPSLVFMLLSGAWQSGHLQWGLQWSVATAKPCTWSLEATPLNYGIWHRHPLRSP